MNPKVLKTTYVKMNGEYAYVCTNLDLDSSWDGDSYILLHAWYLHLDN